MNYRIEPKTVRRRHVSWVVNPPVYEWDLPYVSYTYEYVLTIVFDEPFTNEEWAALREADTKRWVSLFRHLPLSCLVGSFQKLNDTTVRAGFVSAGDRDWCETRIHTELAKLASNQATLAQPAQSPA